MSWGNPQTALRERQQRAAVPANPPKPAREAVAAEKARSNANVTVRVEPLTAVSAKGRYQVPTQWPGFDLELRVAPVLADYEHDLAGLVLSGQFTVVANRVNVPKPTSMFITPRERVRAWGADETFTAMTEDDWRFAVNVARNAIVPAVVTSHVRSLAYYDALPKPQREEGLELFQRWGRAIAMVQDGVEMFDELYGRNDGGGLMVVSGDMDLTVEEILRTRDRARIQSWASQARIVADAAKNAHAASFDEWIAAQ